MRIEWMIAATLVLSTQALSRNPPPSPPFPDRLVIGRHTFFDFGPPNDFYELLLVSPAANGSSIERITLTPAADACVQPAKIEVASAVSGQSITALLGKTNPCAIPEKELHRELKRCKKCLVFSGAHVAMEVQCGSQNRVIRSEILDKDMFDPDPKTPEHTSWTMQLLQRLDQAIGPGVMDKPVFSLTEDKESIVDFDSATLQDLRSGTYDVVFDGAPDKLEDIYFAAQKRPPKPVVRLLNSSPIQPVDFPLPSYPPLAKLAHIDGDVVFAISVKPDGSTTDFTLKSGNPYLRGSVEDAVKRWRFPTEAAGTKIDATIEFATNCPRTKN